MKSQGNIPQGLIRFLLPWVTYFANVSFSSHVIETQTRISRRCIELLTLSEGPKYLLDIGIDLLQLSVKIQF